MKVISHSSLRESLRKLRLQLPLLFGLLGVVLGGTALIHSLFLPKIGVVRTDALVDQYVGMKDARETYKGKYGAWAREADSLDQEFKQALEKYKAEELGLVGTKRAERRQELELLQQSLAQHKSNLVDKANQEDRELTEGALSQINEFVEKYGNDRGYDIILGTNGSGNILCSTKYLDLTEEVIEALNHSYQLADNR